MTPPTRRTATPQTLPPGGAAGVKKRGRGNPAALYAAARAAKLDQQTPKWPELRVSIAEHGSTISSSGITHPLTGDDPQTAAVTFAADQARRNGQPIRLTATMPAGDVHRMIITPDRAVVLLDHASPPGAPPTPPAPTAPPPGGGGRAARTGKKPTRRAVSSGGRLHRFPPRLRPVIRWGVPALVVLLVALITVAVFKGPRHPTPGVAAVPEHPMPPAGVLYTVTAPPGWSQHASWTVPIADQSTPATDPATGVTAALTPDDRTTTGTAQATAADIGGSQPNYLSVLNPDGSTRYAVPLTDRPVFGPVISTVDGATVVLLQTAPDTLTYWAAAAGPATTVDLPAGVSGPLNTAGRSVLIPLGDQHVGYLHHGAVQIMETLPRTTPMFAVDGAVVSVQPDTGAWWTQRVDAAPTSITPTPPAGATGIDQILAITPTVAIISWTTRPTAGGATAPTLITAYQERTGTPIAQTSSPTTPNPGGVVYSDDRHGLTAVDGLVLTAPTGRPARLTLIDGFQPDAAYDAVYGQQQGTPTVITPTGAARTLPAGTLTPVGADQDHLMVTSQNQLYTLPRNFGRSADALSTLSTTR